VADPFSARAVVRSRINDLPFAAILEVVEYGDEIAVITDPASILKGS
jgi:hypothetical protein